jgi:hypothetical protein
MKELHVIIRAISGEFRGRAAVDPSVGFRGTDSAGRDVPHHRRKFRGQTGKFRDGEVSWTEVSWSKVSWTDGDCHLKFRGSFVEKEPQN